ncbi:proline dehydrogenase family protein [Aurantibacillus circumpalustris]|uniref:proline dehydrogenase family protein n=1 Tax=Aurantibacillus circumpalustris TaxID=3036359 RepID=UPI00295AE1BE|nr:proline dehydrogenase family protein [Aurantibacillus circumpalustris]
MISFDNTENAFKAKSNSELSRSYWLFKLISNPLLVKAGATLGPLALNLGFKGIIKGTIFKQFVGGETIEDCNKAIQELGKYNIGTILDYSVEGKESENDFDNCLHETLDTINKAKDDKNIPFCVFKVTGLARFDLLEIVSSGKSLSEVEIAEWERVKKRVKTICTLAYENNQCIFIDAEESWIQQAIDDLADENMLAYNRTKAIVYNTFQLYRSDRLEFLKKSIQQGKTNSYHVGAKLVRGAYMEKERKRAMDKAYPSPIQSTKEKSDDDYNAALRLCIDNIAVMGLCAGTHNEKSSLILVELMHEKKISPSDPRIYFSQLLGMSDHISFNLSLNGYNVAKYVPYGPIKDVMPYLIRRAQENTSVKGQTGRELNLIIREKKRRAQ